MFYNAQMKTRITTTPYFAYMFEYVTIFLICCFAVGCATQQHTTYPPLTTFQDSMRLASTTGPIMIALPPGQFLMGSPLHEPSRTSFESPRHLVTITKSFAISQYEITFKEYDAFVNTTHYTRPSDKGWGSARWGRITTPVFNISWYDAQRYVTWLSAQTGKQYRLPTEAEWEYAARAGTDTPFSTGHCIRTDQANFHGRTPYGDCPESHLYRGKTTAIGTFLPNAWGLYDVHGNVFEWTEDCWHDSYDGAPTDGSAWRDNVFANPANGDLTTKPCRVPSRVLRGGSWSGYAEHLRSANRAANDPNFKSIFIGFRVVREL